MTTQSANVVIVDSWASKSAVRNVVLVLSLTAFTALSAQISVPLHFTPVPLTLQTFAVLAGAGALGAQRAVIGQILYIVLAVVGAPVLAPSDDGSHVTGREVLSMPTFGYLAGFVFASLVVGRIAERGATQKVSATLLAYVAGTATIYLFGATWLAHSTGMSLSWAIANGVTPFLIGDAIKAVAAGAVLPALWKVTKP